MFKTTPAQFAARLFPGLFFLDSGLGKFNADKETADYLQGFASVGMPLATKVDSKTFTKALSIAEIATGAALVAPFVPNRVAGAALTAFSAGFMSLYLRAPGVRKEGSLSPTPDGLALAKDSWILGIGAALLLADSDFNKSKRNR
ncbi:hypothetical protein CRES_1333 [Corynebacterium resistens DSM 45100]|uniref:DoxX family protein n=1 Tax=Corynebacterium resistens (strain DSM 45100 / JCM 12819 / GTC 2026 / SICGH 158) TaxID=662755 RepID=F8DYM4_CORRG|nr:hypothetical protein [Corynebacterium resistens]AEI09689.1 hypothetical protein CRES_1333 [Corynebacterium resistens DSM 45100]